MSLHLPAAAFLLVSRSVKIWLDMIWPRTALWWYSCMQKLCFPSLSGLC